MPSPHEILGIEENASKQRIIQAYKEKSVLHHPDKGGSADMMKLINQARDELLQHIDDAEFVETSIEDLEDILSSRTSVSIDNPQDRISNEFRELHEDLLGKINIDSIKQVPVHVLFKKFKTDLYSDPAPKGSAIQIMKHHDVFDFIKSKKVLTHEQVIKELNVTLTPSNAVKIFVDFVSGECFGNNLVKAKQIFTEALQGTSASHPVYQLYSGILEIITNGKAADLLGSINKILDYAKLNPQESMPYMVILLQDKHFRALFSQALHVFWEKNSKEFKISDLASFNNISMTKSYLGILAKKLVTSIQHQEEDPELLTATTYIKKLYDFEKFTNEGMGELHTASFYREKGFETLDWLTALMPYANRSMLANIFMQAGNFFRSASCAPQDNLTMKIADEKLALHMYMQAMSLSGKSAPDLELYTHINCLKFIAAFKYQDEDTQELVEAIQRRTLFLADLFPVYSKIQSNVDLIKNQGQTLGLFRNLLNTLVDLIEKDKVIIDHDHVNILYQAYEAYVKSWYQETYDPALESKFRLALMKLLLQRNKWTTKHLDWHLQNHAMIPTGKDGWLNLTAKPLRVASLGIANQFGSLEGMEINCKTGEINFRISPERKGFTNSENTLTLRDLNQMLEFNISGASFSLDLIDPQMPYHPFNAMRFAPESIYNTQFLNTMLLSDYILKFLTTGQEVQAIYPYDMRSIEKTIEQLPPHLKKIITDFQEAKKHSIGSIHRFWIEAEQITEATEENDHDVYKIALSSMKMVVKKHTMKRDHNGNLVDTQKDHEGWDLYVFTDTQKLEFDRTGATIKGPAIIFIESWKRAFFIEHKTIYKNTLLPSIRHMELIKQLSSYPRDANNKVIVSLDNETFIYNMIKEVTGWAKEPARFSAEYIFAQEFTAHYDEFAQHILEFARLRELSKITVAVKLLHDHKCGAEQKIRNLQKLLTDLPNWEEKDHHPSNHEDHFAEVLAKQDYIEAQANIQEKITSSQRLLTGLQAIGLGKDEHNHDSIDLKKECLWVPASVRHHVEGNSCHFIYGGVRVMPRINSIERTNQNFNRMMGNAFNSGKNVTTVNAAALSTAKNVQNKASQQAAGTRATSTTRGLQTTSANTSMPVRTQVSNNSSGNVGRGNFASQQAATTSSRTSSQASNSNNYATRAQFSGSFNSTSSRPPATSNASYKAQSSTFTAPRSQASSSSRPNSFNSAGVSSGNPIGGGSSGGGSNGSGGNKYGNNSDFRDDLKLRTELSFKEAGILDRSGKLTVKALECTKNPDNLLVSGEKLVNKEVTTRLLKNGGTLSDWGKYTTEKVMLHTGRTGEIHFYYNKTTGEAVYDVDFKVKGGLGEKANDVSIWDTADGKGQPIKEPTLKYKEGNYI